MPARPVRLAIASRDQTVSRGLARLLAEHPDRVIVVDTVTEGDCVDVVLHDDRDHAEGAEDADDAGDADDADGPACGAAARVPLRLGVEQLLALVEAAAGLEVADAGGSDSAAPALSSREREVLALIAEGLTNQQIADRIFISINSVKTYIRSAYRKIGVNSRSQAVVWGLRHGVVRPPADD